MRITQLKTCSILGCLLPGIVTAEAITGKIVIDGVEYGNNSVIRGNHQRAEQRRSLPCFERINVRASIELYYRPGTQCGARLAGDANLLDLIDTRVTGDQLVIGVTRSIQSEGPLRVEVQSPRLTDLNIRAAADAVLDGIETDRLRIRMGGSSHIEGKGHAKTLEVMASGSGKLDFSRLAANEVQVRVSGSADVVIKALNSLRATISGSGDVLYYGHPGQVYTKVSGAGHVEPAE